MDFEAYRRRPSEEDLKSMAPTLGLDAAKLAAVATGSWTPGPDPWEVEASVVVRVIPVSFGGYAENCYLLGDRQTRRGLVVDPGGSSDSVAQSALEAGLDVETIAITHGHPDHIGGVLALAERLGVSQVAGILKTCRRWTARP
jgi:glyoxylase-like metal-dependent hydrolase (beta-lactamase superfamily II)